MREKAVHLLGASGTWRWWVLFSVPLIVAIAFVNAFASPLPYSDEWHYTQTIVRLQACDLGTLDGWKSALAGMPLRFGHHLVVVPFLFYWPIAELSGFDSRCFMYLTVITFAVEAWLVWRFVFQRSLWAFPVALLFFCPSHYIELMWGWQVTLSFSILFPYVGLVVIHRMPHDGGLRVQARHVVAGLLMCFLGFLSSAGAVFAFPCALLLVALKLSSGRPKRIWIVVMSIATVLAVALQLTGPGHDFHVGLREVGFLLTALGDTILGSPVGQFEFGVNGHSLLGLVVLACGVLVVWRAAVAGALPDLALPLAIAVFGYLSTLSVAVTRDGLANWHLEYTLSAVAGTYAAAYLVWKVDRSRVAAVTFFTMLAVLSGCVLGYVAGFRERGPDYQRYVHSIEDYTRAFLADPHAPKPQPPYMDVNPPLLLFLAAHDHPVFREEPGTRDLEPLPEGARVLSNFRELAPPFTLEVPRARLTRLTVALPDTVAARVVVARIGENELVLRRVHRENTPVPCCGEPGFVCYAGLLVPRVLGVGEHPLRLWMSR